MCGGETDKEIPHYAVFREDSKMDATTMEAYVSSNSGLFTSSPTKVGDAVDVDLGGCVDVRSDMACV